MKNQSNYKPKVNGRVESPCVKICTLDDKDICLGCYRSVDEIIRWHEASNEQRKEILTIAAGRELQRVR